MRGRKCTKIVEFWQVTETADEYGGYVVADELIAKSWCNIKTASNRNADFLNSIGISDTSNAIVIQLRHRNDITYNGINQFIMYNGSRYTIKNITNIDLEDVNVEIVAIKEQTNDVTVIDPINV